MANDQTWRDLLATLIQEPREKRRIAKAIGVDALTLQKWTVHQANPQMQDIRRLLLAIPQHQMLLQALLAEEFDDLNEIVTAPLSERISVAFSARILDIHASTPEEARCWSICTAVLAEAIKQSSPQQSGISFSVVQCIASAQTNQVRYLREYVGLGTAPWPDLVKFRASFLGAESLAGDAISTGSVQIVGDIRQEQHAPCYLPEHAISAAAFPIQHTERIAGCLLVASTQPDYFLSAARCDLLQKYTALLTLAFAPEDFYPREAITLQIMPPLQVQQPYLSTFQQRILATLKTAFNGNHTLSYPEAQQFVWGQIAEELLQLS